MQYKERRSRLFVAIDESNHGRDEEIFAFAFSYTPEFADYHRVPANLEERRAIASQIRICPHLDYRFCVVNRQDYRNFGNHNIPREVARAFFQSCIEDEFDMDSSTLFFDGSLTDKQREDIREASRKIVNARRIPQEKIPYPAISVHAVPKTEEKREGQRVIRANRLLLFADYQSNHLFRAPRFSTTDKRGKYFSKRINFPVDA